MNLTEIFLTVCEMSAAAAIMTIAILIVRQLLKKAKPAKCLLWAAVFLRLICPVTVASVFSVVPDIKVSAGNVPSVYSDGVPIKWQDEINVSVGAADISISDAPRVPYSPAPSFDTQSGGRITLSGIFAVIWLIGAVSMGANGVISYMKLRCKLKNAKNLKDNIFLCDNINSAFITGLFRPVIYIPHGTSEKDMKYIILHENAHIRRGDHIAKLIMYTALCVHWFDPVIWLAFRFCEKDMELYCDSRAAEKLSDSERADYCQALLNIGVSKTAAFRVCFGENGVKQRVGSLLAYKKPGIIGVILSILLTAALLIMLTGHSRIPAKELLGLDPTRLNYGISFESDGKWVSYGSFDKEDIYFQDGEMGQFAKDFFALDLKEVSEYPVFDEKRHAKIYFDYYDITLSEGENSDSGSICALTYLHIKQGIRKYYILNERQSEQLFDDISALLDYKDNIADHDTKPVENIISCDPFKIEKTYRSAVSVLLQEERFELLKNMEQMKFTPLEKKGLTLYEDAALNFYTENEIKKLTCFTALTSDYRKINCISVDGYLYRIDNSDEFDSIVLFAGDRILTAEYILLFPEKYSGFTLNVGDKTADYEAGAMESRTGYEGDLHFVKYQINQSGGAPCKMEGIQYPDNVFRLDCRTDEAADSIILTNTAYGIHTRYYMIINVGCEHNRVNKGTYCYEICENDYNKIIDSGKALLK